MNKKDVKAMFVMVFIFAQVIVFGVIAFVAVFFSSTFNVGLMLFMLCSMMAWNFVLGDLSEEDNQGDDNQADDNLVDEEIEKRLQLISDIK